MTQLYKEVKKCGNIHSDAENFILTSVYRPTKHMGSRWYTSDLHIVTTDI